MARPAKLSESEIDAALPARWIREGDWIKRTYRFTDFSEAFAFMTRVALAAEKADHHPNWSNVWSTVEVALQTHDSGGVTRLDLDLAVAMERFAGETP